MKIVFEISSISAPCVPTRGEDSWKIDLVTKVEFEIAVDFEFDLGA